MSEVKRLPVLTLIIVFANIAAAFATVLGPDLIDQFGFVSSRPSILAAFVCLFLHLNVIHLLGNMVFLAAVGPAVEFAAGAVRFATVYLVGGICGVLVHWIFTMHSADAAPLIGASGAVASVAAFYSIRYMHLRVPIAPNTSVPILAVIAAWVALQVVGGVVRIGEETGGVSYWAHLGGFATGLVLSLFFKAPKLASVSFGHDVLDRMNQRSPAASKMAAEQHLASHPDDLRALRELADAQHMLGERADEIESLTKIVGIASGNELAEALQRLTNLGALNVLPALRRMRLVEQVQKDFPELAAVLLASVIREEDSEPQRPDAILALAELQRTQDEPAAMGLIAELATKYPLHPATELARTRGWQI